ncbi:MAG: DUF177 domain-containing protein [Bacteroidia bacterium]
MAISKLKQFVIPFVGLNDGQHKYHFEVENSFFEHIGCTEIIEKANVSVDLLLTKQSNMLVLAFTLKGTVNVPCDRCLDAFDLPIENQEKLIVKLGKNDFDDDENILAISSTAYEIDVSQPIYEYIVTALPYRRVHPQDENGKSDCNPEVVEKLKQIII